MSSPDLLDHLAVQNVSVYDGGHMALPNVAVDVAPQTSLMDNEVACKLMAYRARLRHLPA